MEVTLKTRSYEWDGRGRTRAGGSRARWISGPGMDVRPRDGYRAQGWISGPGMDIGPMGCPCSHCPRANSIRLCGPQQPVFSKCCHTSKQTQYWLQHPPSDQEPIVYTRGHWKMRLLKIYAFRKVLYEEKMNLQEGSKTTQMHLILNEVLNEEFLPLVVL